MQSLARQTEAVGIEGYCDAFLGRLGTLVRGQVTPLCLILHQLATNAVKFAIGRLDPA